MEANHSITNRHLDPTFTAATYWDVAPLATSLTGTPVLAVSTHKSLNGWPVTRTSHLPGDTISRTIVASALLPDANTSDLSLVPPRQLPGSVVTSFSVSVLTEVTSVNVSQSLPPEPGLLTTAGPVNPTFTVAPLHQQSQNLTTTAHLLTDSSDGGISYSRVEEEVTVSSGTTTSPSQSVAGGSLDLRRDLNVDSVGVRTVGVETAQDTTAAADVPSTSAAVTTTRPADIAATKFIEDSAPLATVMSDESAAWSTSGAVGSTRGENSILHSPATRRMSVEPATVISPTIVESIGTASASAVTGLETETSAELSNFTVTRLPETSILQGLQNVSTSSVLGLESTLVSLDLPTSGSSIHFMTEALPDSSGEAETSGDVIEARTVTTTSSRVVSPTMLSPSSAMVPGGSASVMTSAGLGNSTGTVAGSNVPDSASTKLLIIILPVCLAIVLFIVIIIVMLFCYKRNKKRRDSTTNNEDLWVKPQSEIVPPVTISTSEPTASPTIAFDDVDLSDEIEYRVVHEFPAREDGQLPLCIGDIVYVEEQEDHGWWRGRKKGDNRTGWFPSSFVEEAILHKAGGNMNAAVSMETDMEPDHDTHKPRISSFLIRKKQGNRSLRENSFNLGKLSFPKKPAATTMCSDPILPAIPLVQIPSTGLAVEDFTSSVQGKYFKAVFAYKAAYRGELSMKEGDVILAKERDRNGWMLGIKQQTGEEGWFPAVYVDEIIGEIPRQIREKDKDREIMHLDPEVYNRLAVNRNKSPDQAWLGIEHEAQMPYVGRTESELSFKVGDVITVFEAHETGWWFGCKGDHVGWFPGTYVELMEEILHSDGMSLHSMDLLSVKPCLRPEVKKDGGTPGRLSLASLVSDTKDNSDTKSTISGSSESILGEQNKIKPARRAPRPPSSSDKQLGTSPGTGTLSRNLRPARPAPAPPSQKAESVGSMDTVDLTIPKGHDNGQGNNTSGSPPRKQKKPKVVRIPKEKVGLDKISSCPRPAYVPAQPINAKDVSGDKVAENGGSLLELSAAEGSTGSTGIETVSKPEKSQDPPSGAASFQSSIPVDAVKVSDEQEEDSVSTSSDSSHSSSSQDSDKMRLRPLSFFNDKEPEFSDLLRTVLDSSQHSIPETKKNIPSSSGPDYHVPQVDTNVPDTITRLQGMVSESQFNHCPPKDTLENGEMNVLLQHPFDGAASEQLPALEELRLPASHIRSELPNSASKNEVENDSVENGRNILPKISADKISDPSKGIIASGSAKPSEEIKLPNSGDSLTERSADTLPEDSSDKASDAAASMRPKGYWKFQSGDSQKQEQKQIRLNKVDPPVVPNSDKLGSDLDDKIIVDVPPEGTTGRVSKIVHQINRLASIEEQVPNRRSQSLLHTTANSPNAASSFGPPLTETRGSPELRHSGKIPHPIPNEPEHEKLTLIYYHEKKDKDSLSNGKSKESDDLSVQTNLPAKHHPAHTSSPALKRLSSAIRPKIWQSLQSYNAKKEDELSFAAGIFIKQLGGETTGRPGWGFGMLTDGITGYFPFSSAQVSTKQIQTEL